MRSPSGLRRCDEQGEASRVVVVPSGGNGGGQGSRDRAFAYAEHGEGREVPPHVAWLAGCPRRRDPALHDGREAPVPDRGPGRVPREGAAWTGRSVGVTAAELAARVEQERKAQGLEPRVVSPAVLARLARMVVVRREAQRPERRSA